MRKSERVTAFNGTSPRRAAFLFAAVCLGPAAAAGADCFVHLTGVTHPNPAKARQFIEMMTTRKAPAGASLESARPAMVLAQQLTDAVLAAS